MDDQERQLLQHGWRLEALDKWRGVVDNRLGELEGQVGELVKSDEIADAVAVRVNQDKRLHLTRRQQQWAWLFGSLGALGALSGIVSLVGQAAGAW